MHSTTTRRPWRGETLRALLFRCWQSYGFPGFEATGHGADVLVAHFLQAFRGARRIPKRSGPQSRGESARHRKRLMTLQKSRFAGEEVLAEAPIAGGVFRKCLAKCCREDQCLINLSQTLQNRGISRDFFSQFDKGPDHVNAHRNGMIASQYVCDLKRAMLGEYPWAVFSMLAPAPL